MSKDPDGNVGCTPTPMCCEATLRTIPLPEVLVLTAEPVDVTEKESVSGLVTARSPVKLPCRKVGGLPPYSAE
jgi:hypothetical protein